MREILFRGKRVDNGEWVEGSLINNAFFKSVSGKPCMYIFDNKSVEYDCFEHIASFLDDYEVDPETVGQYTGLDDCNGVKIFENEVGK